MLEKLQSRQLSKLVEWPENYRKGDISAIATSIRRFGFNGALRVWKGSTVIAGNHALFALRQLFDKDPTKPPYGLHLIDGDWDIPVIDVSHLSESEAKAFAIADNRTQEIGGQDEVQLATLLADLSNRGDGLIEACGYTGNELDKLLKLAVPDDVVPDLDGSEQGQLDEREGDVTCPHCGERFTP